MSISSGQPVLSPLKFAAEATMRRAAEKVIEDKINAVRKELEQEMEGIIARTINNISIDPDTNSLIITIGANDNG